MILKKHIASLFLTALMLLATIGVGIYKHSCLMSGHEGVSVFFAESSEDAMSCCAISQGACKKPANDSNQKGCCEETADYVKLDIPQKNQERIAYFAPLLPVLGLVTLPNFDFSITHTAAIAPLRNNMPPPMASQRLATLQVYRL